MGEGSSRMEVGRRQENGEEVVREIGREEKIMEGKGKIKKGGEKKKSGGKGNKGKNQRIVKGMEGTGREGKGS